MHEEIVIVGAGPAGLAVAACLKMRGLRARLLERGANPGWSWSRHYESLRLHTPRSLSSLPGFPLRCTTPYPGRDEFLAYLAAYARKFDLDIDLGCEVTAVQRDGDGWRIETQRGSCRTRHAVLATGFFSVPREPEWPGRGLFRGRWLRPEQAEGDPALAGRRVLIVGLGNTAADLVVELRQRGARVALSVRGPVHAVPLEWFRLNVFRWSQWLPERAVAAARRFGSRGEALTARMAAHAWFHLQERELGDLRAHGLALKSPEQIRQDQSAGRPPVIAGPWVDLVRRGEVPIFPGIASLTEEGAVFADGRRETFDAIVPTLGYEERRFGLAGDLSTPLRDGPVPGRDGLWLCGTAPALRHIRRSARKIARAMARAER
jgi:cation diffusion facilitator CzcD-associated flavoprotein CzcO